MAEIKRQHENGAEVLSVNGEIDASSSIDLDQAILSCVQDGAKKILVDMTQLSYISSAGLGVFMSYLEELKEKKIRMIICGLNSRVAHTFNLLGLADLLEIASSKEDANKMIHEA
ncbi:MAG: STAS domain-containing protein [Cyclobacteriaceae bacterium]|jgi:anti-sigma B factor antagonist